MPPPLMTRAQCWWVWLHTCPQLILGSDGIGNTRTGGNQDPVLIVWCSGCCDSRGHFQGIALHQGLCVHFSYGCLWKRHSHNERERTSAEHRTFHISIVKWHKQCIWCQPGFNGGESGHYIYHQNTIVCGKSIILCVQKSPLHYCCFWKIRKEFVLT